MNPNLQKFAYILKGAIFAVLAIAGLLLIGVLTGNPLIVAGASAYLAGNLMIGNSFLQVVELVVVKPRSYDKWFGVYKTLTLICSIAAAVFLLTAFVADPREAMIAATAAILLCAIVDGVEAAVL